MFFPYEIDPPDGWFQLPKKMSEKVNNKRIHQIRGREDIS